MAGWEIVGSEEVPDVLGDYPGEMRFLTHGLGSEQVAFTYRRMPAQTGSKGSYGHRHKTQEEIYFVISGTLQFKLEDEIVDVGAHTAVRVSPEVVRGVWNEGPDDAELVIVSPRAEDIRAETETVDGFWPDG
jgi:mannose-6-phosphate isomerase-like protein (cupin superfamily)